MSEKKLFEPAVLGELQLKNRIIRSATWEGLADKEGNITEELLAVYEELAKGGAGAIITGFTSVTDDDCYIEAAARLSHDELIPGHKKLTELCHQYDTPVLAQLGLGEYNKVEYGELKRDVDIMDMTSRDILTAEQYFINAAERAYKAGYDGVQLNAAHGFFLSRFISHACNRRKDAYGGSQRNRNNILIRIIRGIRRKTPSLHVSVKLNCSDFMEGGLTPEESFFTCRHCANEGVGSIEISGNGTSVQGIRPWVNEAYFKSFALAFAEEVDVPFILVGGHRSIENMESVLNEGKIEFLSLSRPLIREPDLPKRWQETDKSPAKCVSCNRCYDMPGHKCAWNQQQ